MLGADEEHGVGGKVGVTFGLRDQAGQGVVPEAELAGGSLAHRRVTQVDREVGGLQSSDERFLGDVAVEGDLGFQIQRADGGLHFGAMLDRAEDVDLEAGALGQGREGREKFDDAAVDVQVAEHQEFRAARGRERRRVGAFEAGGGAGTMRERREDCGGVGELADRGERVRGVDHDAQRAVDGPVGHREMLGHEVDGDFLPPVGQSGLVAAMAVEAAHGAEVSRLIAKAFAVNALEEVVELEVVQDHQAGFALAEEPGVGEENRVIAEMVDRQVEVVERREEGGRDVAEGRRVGGAGGGFVEAVRGFREETRCKLLLQVADETVGEVGDLGVLRRER